MPKRTRTVTAWLVVLAPITAGLLATTSANPEGAAVGSLIAMGIVAALPSYRRAVAVATIAVVAALAASAVDRSAVPWAVAAIAGTLATSHTGRTRAETSITAASVSALIAALGAWPASWVSGAVGMTSVASGVGAIAVAIGVAAARHDVISKRPSPLHIRWALSPSFRAPAEHARARAGSGIAATRDARIRAGLDEVAAWVFALQRNRQALTGDLTRLTNRPVVPASPHTSTDAFAQRQHAAAAALRDRHTTHAETLATELSRCEALVDYASAWLDDAVTTLVVARRTTTLAAPVDMHDVLSQLRAHERDREALRRTAAELA